MLRQILAVEVLSPGWLSVRLLSWLCTIAAGGAAALMWLNLRGFGDVLDPVTRDRMFIGASLRHRGGGDLSWPRARAPGPPRRTDQRRDPVDDDGRCRWRRRSLARGPARQPLMPAGDSRGERTCGVASDAHVRMLMLDGASLEVIFSAVAAGRLPNIGRIFDKGAVLHLATLRPTQAEPVWSAIATGRYPMYNGVRSAVVYRALGGTPIQLLPDYCFAQALVTFGFLTEQPQTPNDLLARPIWNILSDRGASVGVIGWPLTQPAPAVNGFVVSDAFHRLPDTELSLERTPALWPPDLLAEALRGAANAGGSGSGDAGHGDGRAAAGQRLRRAQRSGADRRRSCASATAERARGRRRRDCSRCVSPASTPSAIDSCATRIRRRLATCPRPSARSSAAC